MKYIRQANKEAWGILMMSHMATPEILLEEAKKMESYGAQAIVIMDSAGAQLVDDVRARIATLVNGLSIPVGFHGHNNLGMALVNSITAVQEGATILDGTIRGFGAGAGNTQLEVLVGVLHKLGFETGIDLFKILDAASMAEKELNFVAPTISAISLVSGLAGVFSGFAKPVARAAIEYGVDPREIFFNLGKRKAVAGQESLIIEVARELKRDR
ncbi:4-hydroxy-2-ketovalerate aldolase [Pseudomonas sp. CF161]|nr:4-hydroxy-2-ketovalerate aldolase [Pseudomonas sp. CF161]